MHACADVASTPRLGDGHRNNIQRQSQKSNADLSTRASEIVYDFSERETAAFDPPSQKPTLA